MRKVQCADCGKSYDYDVDDFCPRCGSFNPPPDGGATRLEQELLSRFQRTGQARSPSSGKQIPTAVSRPSSGSGAQRAKQNRLSGPEVKKKRGLSLVFGIIAILVVIFVFVVPLIEFGLEQASELIYTWSDSFGDSQEENGSAGDEDNVSEPFYGDESEYEVYETFSINGGQKITVGDPWEPWLPDDVMALYPDTRCVAVVLWVEGVPGEVSSEAPLLISGSGESYWAQRIPDEVVEETGLENLWPSDGVEGEEKFGYAFFFLPEEEVGESLTLAIMDMEQENWFSYVPLDMEWGA